MIWTHSRMVCGSCTLLLGITAALSCEIARGATAVCIKESDCVRARQQGIAPGVLAPGPLNAITHRR